METANTITTADATASALPPTTTDSSDSSTSTSTSTGTSSQQPDRPADHEAAASRPRKNVSRERLTAELKFLRAKVVELEREAQELEERNQVRAVLVSTSAAAWQSVVTEQRTQRRIAELENEQLKRAMDRQLGMARSLESLLQRKRPRSCSELHETEDDGSDRKRLPPAMPRGHTRTCDRTTGGVGANSAVRMLFAQFQREVEQRLYPMLDSVYHELQTVEAMIYAQARPPTLITQRGAVVEGLEQSFIESWAHKWVPFAFERVCDAAWRANVADFSKPSRDIHASIFTDSLIAIKANNKCYNQETQRWLTLVLVMKKFVEADRMVMVWRGMWTIPESDDDSDIIQPAYMDEMGWIVVQRVPEAHGGQEGDTAVMVTCSRCAPLWTALEDGLQQVATAETVNETAQPRTGDLTMMVLNSIEEDLTATTEAMESMLLEDALEFE